MPPQVGRGGSGGGSAVKQAPLVEDQKKKSVRIKRKAHRVQLVRTEQWTGGDIKTYEQIMREFDQKIKEVAQALSG